MATKEEKKTKSKPQPCVPVYSNDKQQLQFRSYYCLQIDVHKIHLEKKFMEVGSLKPDPYIRISVNNQYWDSLKVANAHDVDWTHDDDKKKDDNIDNKKGSHKCGHHATEFILTQPVFRMKFEVYDDNENTTDELLGEATLKWKQWENGFKAHGELSLEKNYSDTGGTVTVTVIGTVLDYETFQRSSNKIKKMHKDIDNLRKTDNDQKKELKEWKESQKDYIEQIQNFVDMKSMDSAFDVVA
eukprot:282370_1